jgi:hypothetical protein
LLRNSGGGGLAVTIFGISAAAQDQNTPLGRAVLQRVSDDAQACLHIPELPALLIFLAELRHPQIALSKQPLQFLPAPPLQRSVREEDIPLSAPPAPPNVTDYQIEVIRKDKKPRRVHETTGATRHQQTRHGLSLSRLSISIP